jgi:NAD(P)H-nitrite reductase large subunit
VKEVDEAVVIGSGAHAIETVTSLRGLGVRVHWLMRGKAVLSRLLDQEASEMALQHLREAGARVCTETEVVGILGKLGVVAGVVTNRQRMIPCQLVLACTGTVPLTTLADHCTLPMRHQRAILVDSRLRTTVPNIYAAGDVAALENPRTGIHEERAQWHAAVVQGRRAAAMMTGREGATPAHSGAPWLATQVGRLALLAVGDPLLCAERAATLTRRRPGCYRRLTVIDDRLVGFLSLGPTQPDAFAIKRLIDEGCSIGDVKEALLKGTFDAGMYFWRAALPEKRAPSLFTTPPLLSRQRSLTRGPEIGSVRERGR